MRAHDLRRLEPEKRQHDDQSGGGENLRRRRRRTHLADLTNFIVPRLVQRRRRSELGDVRRGETSVARVSTGAWHATASVGETTIGVHARRLRARVYVRHRVRPRLVIARAVVRRRADERDVVASPIRERRTRVRIASFDERPGTRRVPERIARLPRRSIRVGAQCVVGTVPTRRRRRRRRRRRARWTRRRRGECRRARHGECGGVSQTHDV